MKKDLKITYLKKPKKFLDKQSVISETDVDELVIKFVKRHFYGADTNFSFPRSAWECIHPSLRRV